MNTNATGNTNMVEAKLSSAMERWSVMIEYILIQDVNNLEAHAHELGQMLSVSELRRRHVILNLIPYNPTEVAEDYK
jgi:adenine C2-methylase RlmN of 23S rRNA A2503 and tRNA A37